MNNAAGSKSGSIPLDRHVVRLNLDQAMVAA
jgi:hypothetical protein